MSKKAQSGLAIFGIITAAIIALLVFGAAFNVIVLDNFRVEEGFDAGTQIDCSTDPCNAETFTLSRKGGLTGQQWEFDPTVFTDGKIVLSQRGYANTVLKMKRDLRFQDFRFQFDYSVSEAGQFSGNKQGQVDVLLGGQLIFTAKGNEFGSIVIDGRVDVLDLSRTFININGIESGEIAAGSSPMTIELRVTSQGRKEKNTWLGAASANIDFLSFKLPFSCTQGDNDVLVIEPFQPGDTVSLETTTREVKALCKENLPLVVENSNAETSVLILESMASGEELVVPENQIWTVFYIAEAPGEGCADDEGFSVPNDACVPLNAVEVVCRGALDPNTGTCLIETEKLCVDNNGAAIENAFYNVESNTCTQRLPTDNVCVGADGAIFEGARIGEAGCVRELPTEIACDIEGGVYDESTELCIIEPKTELSNEIAAASGLTKFLGVALVIAVIVILALLFLRRRKKS